MSDCNTRTEPATINCDEVSWIMRELDVLLGTAVSSTATRGRTEAVKVSCLLGIMSILDLDFEDRGAAGNAIANLGVLPRHLLPERFKSPTTQQKKEEGER